jgi:putative SOS response-associated peptidase YedK
VCNLYSITKSQQAIRDLVKAMRDLAGNVPPLPAIFPDRLAPVVRTAADGVRELAMMRWGFPPPSFPGQKSARPVTNIRNTTSRHWTPWLKKPEHRCLVPVTSFAEPDNNQGPRSIWTWFAQDESRPLTFFAGVWREWEGTRGTKADPATGKHLLFSFLTTDASPDVAPIHPDATPVLLLDEGARDMWMNAPIEMALSLQRPPPAGALKIVATDRKEDPAAPDIV